MAKHSFSPAERYAVFTVHGETCYLCNAPLNLKTMEVDHVIPESLLDKPKRLAEVLKALGRPDDFDLNWFANWLPACRPCNGRKLDMVFESSLLVQLALQQAADKAGEAAALAEQTVSERKLANALNLIEQVSDAGPLPDWIFDTLKPLVLFHEHHRVRKLTGEPIRITPFYEVLSEKDGIRLVRGPYGIGGGPIGPNIHSSFRCPNCDMVGWNGARCVFCGEMSDD